MILEPAMKIFFRHTNKLATNIVLLSSLLASSLFTPALAETRGEQLYLDNCSICHGDEGMGGMGIPLALESFLDSASDDYLRQTIRVGRPGRIMPSFYWLSDKDVSDIIHFISSWRKSPAPVWPNDPVKGDANKGKILFTKHCTSCHGDSGKGGAGSGVSFSRVNNLPISAPSINNQGFLNSAPDQMLSHIITQGRKGTPMPSASALKLTKQDVNDLVSFLRSQQKSHLTKKPLYRTEPPSLVVDSPYTFEETIENIKRAISGSNFAHIRDQALLEGFTLDDKGAGRQMIIYFCNFSFLYEALKIDPRVGMFLPCRITVTETDGKVQMMSINPKHLSQIFNNADLDRSCDEMYELYSGILEDASL